MTGWKQIVCPLFNVIDWDIETGRDDAAFVETAGQIDHDLSGTMVVDDLELADVAMFHHHGQKLDDDFGAWAQQNLTLSTFLGIVDTLKGIG